MLCCSHEASKQQMSWQIRRAAHLDGMIWVPVVTSSSVLGLTAPSPSHLPSPSQEIVRCPLIIIVAVAVLLSEVIQDPLPLKPGISSKSSVVLIKRKDGFTKTIPWTENPGKIRRRVF